MVKKDDPGSPLCIDFNKSADGLVVAIAQDAKSKRILMQAFMNEEAFNRTVELGEAVYYSRSRDELWHKGATSGSVQTVEQILVDCDQDSIVLMVNQAGSGACHTGEASCFYREVVRDEESGEPALKML